MVVDKRYDLFFYFFSVFWPPFIFAQMSFSFGRVLFFMSELKMFQSFYFGLQACLLLIEWGAMLTAVDKNNKTPADLADANHKKQVAELLREKM